MAWFREFPRGNFQDKKISVLCNGKRRLSSFTSNSFKMQFGKTGNVRDGEYHRCCMQGNETSTDIFSGIKFLIAKIRPICVYKRTHGRQSPEMLLWEWGCVTYSTDGTCLSWVWRESSILWGVEGGTSGGGEELYCIYMWSLCGEV